MRSTLMAGTALVALTLAGVPTLAQDQQDPATQPIPPAGEAPAEVQGAPVTGESPADAGAMSEAPAAGEEGTTAEAPAAGEEGMSAEAPAAGEDAATEEMAETGAAAGGEMFITAQDPQQALANDMIGAQLLGPDDEAIGSVSDLVLDDQRKVTAAVVGVGGFLGIGEKNVAIAIEEIEEVSSEPGQVVFRVDASKEVLEGAPEFVTVAEQQSEAPAVPAGDTAAPATPPASTQ